MLSLPPVSKAGRPERVSRRKRDAVQAEPVERRADAVQPVEERRKGGRGRRREEQDASRAAPAASRPAFAPLVAQLIATSIGAPQTRPRRRAAVQDAINAYAKAGDKKPRSGGSSA